MQKIMRTKPLPDKAKGIKACETGGRGGQGGLQVVKSEEHCVEQGRAKQDWRQSSAVWNNAKGSADCVTEKRGGEEGRTELKVNANKLVLRFFFVFSLFYSA